MHHLPQDPQIYFHCVSLGLPAYMMHLPREPAGNRTRVSARVLAPIVRPIFTVPLPFRPQAQSLLPATTLAAPKPRRFDMATAKTFLTHRCLLPAVPGIVRRVVLVSLRLSFHNRRTTVVVVKVVVARRIMTLPCTTNGTFAPCQRNVTTATCLDSLCHATPP